MHSEHDRIEVFIISACSSWQETFFKCFKVQHLMLMRLNTSWEGREYKGLMRCRVCSKHHLFECYNIHTIYHFHEGFFTFLDVFCVPAISVCFLCFLVLFLHLTCATSCVSCFAAITMSHLICRLC